MKKIIAVVLSLCVVLGCASFAIASDATIEKDYVVSEKIRNVSVTMAQDSQSSVGVCWHTDEESATAVQFVIAEDYAGTFEGAKTFRGSCESFKEIYVHKVKLTALKPGTEYLYRVGDDVADEWSEIRSFTTDNGDENFKFIAITDVQAGNEDNFRKASNVMKTAYETMPDADFFAHMGDYVNDCTQEEWDWYFNNFNFVHSSLVHVPAAGNHDGNITNKINHYWFDSMFNMDPPEECIRAEGVYYAFDYGNAHIVVLNTNDMYPMTVQQTNWIKNEMNSSDAQWKIILMHRAFYSAGKNLIKPDTIIMREQLLPLFDELDIDFVMAGHDHVYMRTHQVKGDKLVEDVTYVTEDFNGVETTFAVDPDGACHVLPGTAGTKTYSINDYVFDCVFDSNIVANCFSQRDIGDRGIFSTVEIQGGKLVYNAYAVDYETGEKELVDTYAIKKTTEGEASDKTMLPTDSATTGVAQTFNFIYRFGKMFFDYLFIIIPKLIINAI
ncbi:MAG: metallophosphoesterase family protein [Clostridia bacterium]|nr:metallophosphoesterase family protein [Clostridia bacterium]